MNQTIFNSNSYSEKSPVMRLVRSTFGCDSENRNNFQSEVKTWNYIPECNENFRMKSRKLEEYEPLGTIGHGSFGKIVRIRRRGDMKRLFVWKELDYRSMSGFEKDQIVSEVNILRKLSRRRSPCIVRFFDRFVDENIGKVYIVMEHCENGDLAGLIESHRRSGIPILESFIWKVMAQLVSAINECHRQCSDEGKNPILHRDLKPANILLDKYMNAKLCDFGLAIEMTSKDCAKGGLKDTEKRELIFKNHQSPTKVTNIALGDVACGTPLYMAPERIRNCRYDERSDIWSLGCVIFELASLRHPFDSENEQELIMKIESKNMIAIPCGYSLELNDTCMWMLERDYRMRPRIENIYNLSQLQLTLREINCHMNESILSSKNSIFQNRIARELEFMKQKETELLAREANIRKREREIQGPGLRYTLGERKVIQVSQQSQQSYTLDDCHVIEPTPPTTIHSRKQRIYDCKLPLNFSFESVNERYDWLPSPKSYNRLSTRNEHDLESNQRRQYEASIDNGNNLYYDGYLTSYKRQRRN